ELTEHTSELKNKVDTLTKDLESAKDTSRLDLFGDVAVTTSAKIFTTAFWATTFAGLGHLTGYLDIADLLERLHDAVSEPPIGPLDDRDSWKDPPTDV
ncbi:MAG: hypothetical protein AAFQ39_16370, partial [Pseudomonadota bacterium]